MERLEQIAKNYKLNTVIIDTYIFIATTFIGSFGNKVFPNLDFTIYHYIYYGGTEDILEKSRKIQDFILRQEQRMNFEKNQLELVSDYIAFRLKTMEDGEIGRKFTDEEIFAIVQNLINLQSNFKFF